MWYYEICGKFSGPVSEDEILKLFGQRTVGLRTRVWAVGEKEWVDFERTSLIVKALPMPCTPPRLNSPPPLKPNANSKAKSRIIFVLLALLLGPLGIHNFYIRDKIYGWFQLSAFSVVVVIWGLTAKIDSSIPAVLTMIAFCALYYWSFSDAEKVRVDGEGYPLK
jgi:TM2 domain-containing membrane protein YozV